MLNIRSSLTKSSFLSPAKKIHGVLTTTKNEIVIDRVILKEVAEYKFLRKLIIPGVCLGRGRERTSTETEMCVVDNIKNIL